MNHTKLPRVVIIGGGFGGLNAAKALKKTPVEIILFDRSNHHLFQPLLYQVATASLSPGNIAIPIREVLSHQANVTVFLADIVEIKKEKKEIVIANGDRFYYDFLIVATGARHSYFGHPEWEAFAPGLKTISDAITIRERILLSYERAERCRTEEEAAKFMRFVVIGGGPTGVEMAGAIAEIAHETLLRNFRHIKPEQTKIYLIEGTNQVLPSFPKDLAEKAQRDLEKLGVEVRLNTFVTNVTAEGVWMSDVLLESPNVIWAAGNTASPLLKSLDIPLDRCQRAITNPDLSIPGHSNVFIIGDAAHNPDKDGKPLPGVAPVAIQQGRYVAKLIANNIAPDKRKPFVYFDKGMMATIGRGKAIVITGKGAVKISGFFAWLAWSFVHLAYLVSFSNRLLVMIQWFYLYLTDRRRIRLIAHRISEWEDPIHPILPSPSNDKPF